MASTYRIARWRETFENHDKRRQKPLTFVTAPVDLGSKGIRVLLSRGQRGLEAYAVFHLLVQVAGELPVAMRDGSLLRKDGSPYTVETLAAKLGLSQATVERAIEELKSDLVGWILNVRQVSEKAGHLETSGDVQKFPPNRTERNGTERNGTERESVSSRARSRTDARGSRLPEGWKPRPEDHERAVTLGLDPAGVLEAFSDYWRAQPGQRGVKVDWDATWRNWCREEARRTKARGSTRSGRQRSPARNFERLARSGAYERAEDDGDGDANDR